LSVFDLERCNDERSTRNPQLASIVVGLIALSLAGKFAERA
jgi:hypothetical protein